MVESERSLHEEFLMGLKGILLIQRELSMGQHLNELLEKVDKIIQDPKPDIEIDNGELRRNNCMEKYVEFIPLTAQESLLSLSMTADESSTLLASSPSPTLTSASSKACSSSSSSGSPSCPSPSSEQPQQPPRPEERPPGGSKRFSTVRRSPSPYRGSCITTAAAVYCAPPVIAGSSQAGPSTLRNTRARAGATRTRGYSDEDEEVSYYMTDPLVSEVLHVK